ncbi:MAG: proton-conducting transporter transmembrane domain-containing protein, partial [Planctomycetota bacterium]
MWIWPALLLLIPLAGALVVVLAPARQAKWIALVASTATFVVSVILAGAFEHWRDGGFGLAASVPGLGLETVGITITFGADSVSMLLTLLTTLLMPLCVWGSFSAITERVKEYYAWMLVIGAAMVGVFIARDLILFYICFEFTLVPMYFLIAIWGSENRARACT